MYYSKFDINGGSQNKVSAMWIKDGFYAQLHRTVVFIKEKNKVTLNSGGYKTNSTKNVINNCLKQLGINAYLYQKKHIWYVDINDQLDSKTTIEFKDGLVIKGV